MIKIVGAWKYRRIYTQPAKCAMNLYRIYRKSFIQVICDNVVVWVTSIVPIEIVQDESPVFGTMTISLFYWRCDILYVSKRLSQFEGVNCTTCNMTCTWIVRGHEKGFGLELYVIDQMSTFIPFSEIERTSNPNIPKYSR